MQILINTDRNLEGNDQLVQRVEAVHLPLHGNPNIYPDTREND